MEFGGDVVEDVAENAFAWLGMGVVRGWVLPLAICPASQKTPSAAVSTENASSLPTRTPSQ